MEELNIQEEAGFMKEEDVEAAGEADAAEAEPAAAVEAVNDEGALDDEDEDDHLVADDEGLGEDVFDDLDEELSRGRELNTAAYPKLSQLDIKGQ
ncbi:hypothetical protein JTB14_029147 [Gonioctena quinquepunctata]|nr:hypothetical protein JTB14_029147 [Gonioctena quinquepunctata]